MTRFVLALILLLALGLQTSPSAADTLSASDSDTIFSYAEATYPQFLSPPGAVSHTADIYYYRYYAGTNAYIATANGRFYYLGPASNNQILDLGASSDWLSTSMGLLAGSVVFPGPYPRSGAVTYTHASNASVTVRAYPGQVLVYFNVLTGGTSSAALSQREASIRSNGGTVIQKIPLIGLYLAQVSSGQENQFIQAMRSGGFGVDLALPNMAQSAKVSDPVSIDDACWIGVGTCLVPKYIPLDLMCSGPTCPKPKYVPLNVGAGIVILDSGSHGKDVSYTAQRAGGNVSAIVQLPIDEFDRTSLANEAATIAAVINGAAIFSPGKNVIANFSWGVSAACEDDPTISCGNDPDYPINWGDEAKLIDSTIKSTMDQLPASQRDRFALVQALGNAGQDISTAFGNTYAAQVSAGISRNHFYVGATDAGSNSTQVSDPNYHGKIGWYPGCIGPGGLCGTSFSTPALSAFIYQVAQRTNGTLAQAEVAVRQALAANPTGAPTDIVNSAEAIITGNGNPAITESSAVCIVGGYYYNTTEIDHYKVTLSGTASGPVGSWFTGTGTITCSSWTKCWREQGEPATTNWTKTYSPNPTWIRTSTGYRYAGTESSSFRLYVGGSGGQAIEKTISFPCPVK